MNKSTILLISLLCFSHLTFAEETMLNINVTNSNEQASLSGSDSQFTGKVRIDNLFQAPLPAKIGGALVTFEPGARTHWHTHPLGQTLFVTQGTGWVQEWGKPKQVINQGDKVWIPNGVKHWHGASDKTAMIHFAIAESQNGSAVEWMENVTDEQYLSDNEDTK